MTDMNYDTTTTPVHLLVLGKGNTFPLCSEPAVLFHTQIIDYSTDSSHVRFSTKHGNIVQTSLHLMNRPSYVHHTQGVKMAHPNTLTHIREALPCRSKSVMTRSP